MLLLLTSCKKFVEVEPPKTDIVRSAVFSSDATATAAIMDIYHQMITSGFASGDNSSISYLAGLSADELNLYESSTLSQARKEFYDNAITAGNSIISSNLWGEPYQYIYKANAILEGLPQSNQLSQSVANHLKGEALFVRAFSNFYLVNLFGDIPLILTTDYQANTSVGRLGEEKVYEQIIKDLKEAQQLLSDEYISVERVRPNKACATALLSRVELYTHDWLSAEQSATEVIDNSSQYSLANDLNAVFLQNSVETIWQLLPNNGYTWEGSIYVLSGAPSNVALTNQLVNAFEPGDLRKANWTNSVVDGAQTYYYPFKYKAPGGTSSGEYSMVMRLAELYLIRAEARAEQNNLSGASSDLNTIRSRAGLQDAAPISKEELLSAIEQERRVELFTEWGHRWLDLKRYHHSDVALAPIKPAWQSTDILYPIPLVQLQNDPAMNNAQNPGY